MSFHHEDRFLQSLSAVDAENAQDPQVATWIGCAIPRELLFSQRVTHWVRQIEKQPIESLLLAARAHTLRRWDIPRSAYPMDNIGYHEWRDACAAHHAKLAESILRAHGYDNSFVGEVVDLILKRNWPENPNARVLEDADCLAFLELKLADYVDDWEQEKAVRILRRTLAKMTPKAIALASSIPLNPQCAELLVMASRKPD